MADLDVFNLLIYAFMNTFDFYWLENKCENIIKKQILT